MLAGERAPAPRTVQAAPSVCPLPAGAGKMEAVIEKECSALGGLFQTIISDMKVGRRGRGCGGRGRGRARTSPRCFASTPGPAALPLPEPWPPATCGSAPAGCHLLTRGAAPGSAGSPGGLLLWGCLMPPCPCPLHAHCPRGRHHLVSMGAQGPGSKFSIVYRCTECLRPVKTGSLGGHLIPPSPGWGVGGLARWWGVVWGLCPAAGTGPPPSPQSERLGERPSSPSLAFRSTWRGEGGRI